MYPINPTNYGSYNYGSVQGQGNGLIRVTGIEGAKAYQMSPNSTAALFDGGEDLMYIKSTDGAGFPTIRTFRFEAVENNPQPAGDYVSRADLEAFREGVMNDVQQLIWQQSNNSAGNDGKSNDSNSKRK